MKNKISTLAVIASSWMLAMLFTTTSAAQSNQNAEATLDLRAVDRNGNPISEFVAGQYIRLEVSASYKNLPPKVSARLNCSATYTTNLLGRRVSYNFRLPTSGSAGDTSIANNAEGQPADREFRNTTYREMIDFQIPPESPAGKITIKVSAMVTSAKPVKRNFTFNIVRR